MAAELQADYLTGKVVYYLLRNSTGSIWNGSAFVAYATADYANYDIAATEQGTASGYFTANAPTLDPGIYYVVAKERIGGAPAESDPTVGTGVIQWNGSNADFNVYTAKAWMVDDNANTADRYLVAWYRNGIPLSSGVTLATIQVFKASDGTDLIASSSMTQVGTSGKWRYNATGTERVASGAMYWIKMQATIDSVTRTWEQPMSRDST